MSLSKKEQMDKQAYMNQVQGMDKDLLVNKIYDTTVCKLLFSYMN